MAQDDPTLADFRERTLHAIWRIVASLALEGCAIMGTVRRSVRARGSGVAYPVLARWGGAATYLAGLSYGALGYLEAARAPTT